MYTNIFKRKGADRPWCPICNGVTEDGVHAIWSSNKIKFLADFTTKSAIAIDNLAGLLIFNVFIRKNSFRCNF